MKTNIKILAVCLVLAFTFIGCSNTMTDDLDDEVDIKEILGDRITMKEADHYFVWEGDNSIQDSDEFGKAISEKIEITVSEIDTEKDTAILSISAPDLKELLLNQLPSDLSGDYDELMNDYHDNILEAISECKKEDMVVSEIEVKIKNDNGYKIVSDSDFFDAMMPGLYELLAETLLDICSTGE